MIPCPRYVWSAADIAHWHVPDSCRLHLTTQGLPYTLLWTTIEFGQFDSDNAMVIGQDYETAIYLTEDGCVWLDSSGDMQAPT